MEDDSHYRLRWSPDLQKAFDLTEIKGDELDELNAVMMAQEGIQVRSSFRITDEASYLIYGAPRVRESVRRVLGITG